MADLVTYIGIAVYIACGVVMIYLATFLFTRESWKETGLFLFVGACFGYFAYLIWSTMA